ncbi:MAG: hypothetical protein JOY90_08725 [Bradyrhizobium sp.]|uniref:hypothetical protein n=1 Tax=Bradyrhizobium sp. TaxID=376 RepID=UPI001DD156A6|nr:hypothetical protein [Bradyrhizobium sp.]MBV9560531.1 hypothetical protein [Bradyrhizobium sp.]
MKSVVSALIVIGLVTASHAQSGNTTAAPAAPAQANQAAAPSGTAGKRADCQAAAKAAQGQEQRDQMQLCMAQAHLDCLKQAIDQKVVGPQRRDFVRSCVGG